MKIISKFQDYYDSVLSFGQDDSIVFKRFTEIKDFPYHAVMPYSIKPYTFDKEVWFNGFSNPFYSSYLNNFVVAFCGKLYYGFKLKYTEQYVQGIGFREGEVCFYSMEAFIKFILSKGAKELPVAKKRNIYFWKKAKDPTPSKCIEKQGRIHRQQQLIENRVVTAVWMEPEVQFYDRRNLFIINPRLKNFDFAKVFDPASAFQELSMYLGGILTPEGNPLVEIEDKHRISQHGFDKWSFRKLPEK